MVQRLSSILSAKFSQKDDLSKQLEIVKVFDLVRAELKKIKFNDVKLISLKNKTLTLHIESSVAANELRLREDAIIKSINQDLGKEVLRRMVYRF